MMNSPDGIIHEEESHFPTPEQKKEPEETNRPSMFGAFKKFFTEKVIGVDDDKYA